MGEVRAAGVGGRGKEGGSTAAARPLLGVAGADAVVSAAGGVRLMGADMVLSDMEWRCCGTEAVVSGCGVVVAVAVVATCC